MAVGNRIECPRLIKSKRRYILFQYLHKGGIRFCEDNPFRSAAQCIEADSPSPPYPLRGEDRGEGFLEKNLKLDYNCFIAKIWSGNGRIGDYKRQTERQGFLRIKRFPRK